MKQIQQENDEILQKLKSTEERCRLLNVETTKLNDSFRLIEERLNEEKRQKHLFEQKLKESLNKLSNLDSIKENNGSISKLESKIVDLQMELENESKHLAEAQKISRNKERRIRELQFQV